ncbi:MAG: tyrosine-type recombinase/integrase [Cyclobacteriaceae bacterium]
MNLNQKFSILFWLKKSKMNKQGLVPIWARITVDGHRAEFSTQKQVLPEHWDPEESIVKKECKDAKTLNEFLTLSKVEITRHYNILLSTKEVVTADDVRDSYRGIKEEQKSFFDLFGQYMQNLNERKEINDISEGRFKRFEILQGKCLDFIQHKFKRTDVILEHVKMNFIVEFVHYLRTIQKIGHNTAMKYGKDLKQVIKYGVMLEYFIKSPFEFFKCTYKKTKRKFLDDVELNLIYNKQFKIKRLEEVRDVYIFCCYTGYAYSDVAALKPTDVGRGIDGEQWIIRDRKKTDSVENVPLLPIPIEIIKKYKNHPYCLASGKLLPVNSNQRYNSYLKEIADLCGITKNLTTHTARHTFGTTVTLNNDVPIETVQELMGHEDIRTTRIYAQIVQKKLSADMGRLKEKLTSKENVQNDLQHAS